MHTKEDLAQNIRHIGVKPGDTVFIRATLRNVGRIKGSAKAEFLSALKDTVGPEGTIVTLGFTKSFPFWRVDKDFVFSTNTPATTGALAKIFLSDPECKRSKHPACSFLAIGKNAGLIVDGHTPESQSYSPMEKLINLNAKMILVGCVSDSPGFTTVHYAQQVLGLTSRSFLKNVFQVYYKNHENRTVLFKRADVGGCSAGFSNFYSNYISKECLQSGFVGSAYSILINARDAFDIEKELLSSNPRYALCDNPTCITCRCSWFYNKRDIPGYIIRKTISTLKSAVK